MPDIAVGMNARLILFDIEYHGHRIETHFRLGPETHRFVAPAPTNVDRRGLLTLANVDRYCHREGDRCLVYLNEIWWPDYDVQFKTLEHGNYARIVVPPSERYACPTNLIVDWTQQNLPDDTILDMADGLSPSLLGDDEVRMLATPNIEDANDDLHSLVQSNAFVSALPAVLPEQSSPATAAEHCPVDLSSSDDVELEDWFIDLSRILQRWSIQHGDPSEFSVPVYTSFLDHESQRVCSTPKITHLSEDESLWEEDLKFPWRHQLDHMQRTFLNVVLPMPPVADTELHAAHVILTQRPGASFSVLLSLECEHLELPTIFVRIATALFSPCSLTHIVQVAKVLQHVTAERLEFVLPIPDTGLVTLRDGLPIRLRIRPDPTVGTGFDDHSLFQQKFGHSSANDHIEGELELPTAPVCSITDELLAAINAANNALALEPPPIDPNSIEAQHEAFRVLSERISEASTLPKCISHLAHRVESWFLDHTGRHTRCHTSRIVMLSEDFTTWHASFASVWNDRLEGSLDFSIHLVHPESEDKAAGTTSVTPIFN